MTRETLESVIDKILEMHRLGREVDTVVEACGLPEARLHLLKFTDFIAIAELLNEGNFKIEDTGSGPYRYVYTFTYRGVQVFTMEHHLQEIPAKAGKPCET